mgnify:CR=1 FL=1
MSPTQKHRRVHHLGEAHVHDVLALEVDLRRAARALDDDDVSLLGEAVIRLRVSGTSCRFVRKYSDAFIWPRTSPLTMT